jgi:hypothetical protein
MIILHIVQWNPWAMFSNIIHSFSFHLNLCPPNPDFMYWTIQFANELIEYFHALWILAQCLSVIYAI